MIAGLLYLRSLRFHVAIEDGRNLRSFFTSRLRPRRYKPVSWRAMVGRPGGGRNESGCSFRARVMDLRHQLELGRYGVPEEALITTATDGLCRCGRPTERIRPNEHAADDWFICTGCSYVPEHCRCEALEQAPTAPVLSPEPPAHNDSHAPAAGLERLGVPPRQVVRAFTVAPHRLAAVGGPDARSCAHCGAPAWRESFDADALCAACGEPLKSGASPRAGRSYMAPDAEPFHPEPDCPACLDTGTVRGPGGEDVPCSCAAGVVALLLQVARAGQAARADDRASCARCQDQGTVPALDGERMTCGCSIGALVARALLLLRGACGREPKRFPHVGDGDPVWCRSCGAQLTLRVPEGGAP